MRNDSARLSGEQVTCDGMIMISALYLSNTFSWIFIVLTHWNMISALYLSNTFSWIFIVLTHWNNNLRVDMSLHSDTLSWFWAKQYLLLLLKAGWYAEKSQIPIVEFLVWPDQGLNPWSMWALLTIYNIHGLLLLVKFCIDYILSFTQ
jgi:hypothetical protein